MLTAIIRANASPGALAMTLSSLVPAVAEGLVSHAVVLLGAADADAERIADAMGATVLIAQPAARTMIWAEGARIARGQWLLLLEAGEAPDQGWIHAAERHLMLAGASMARPALFPAGGLMASLRERLLPAGGRPRPGLLAPRQWVLAGGGARPVRLGVRRRAMAG